MLKRSVAQPLANTAAHSTPSQDVALAEFVDTEEGSDAESQEFNRVEESGMEALV